MRISPGLQLTVICLAGFVLAAASRDASAQDLSAHRVKTSIDLAKRFLEGTQRRDGAWDWPAGEEHEVGITSLALLSLVNAGELPDHGPLLRGLNYLRKIDPAEQPKWNYDASLMLMALCAAKQPGDLPRITALAQRLEKSQFDVKTDRGKDYGGWGYSTRLAGTTDTSNSQYVVLGLREAAEYGVPVSRDVWTRAQEYWLRQQNPDGGWGYREMNSTGSMTVAGLSSLSIIQQMLVTDEGVSPDGIPPCCRENTDDAAIERGARWLGSHFAAGHNPGNAGWLMYYLYGLERAGRLTGQRFFGDHDWYREGAGFLLEGQDPDVGFWKGAGQYEERSTVLATSFSLLFLSKGLAPVLINKLKFGPRQPVKNLEIVGNDWNRHSRDVRNLVDGLSGTKGWPSLLTTQELDLPRAASAKNIDALLQAPVLYISSTDSPKFNPDELKLLKDYVQNGGFIFGVAACDPGDFEPGFREFVRQILPPGENELKPLSPEHPVFRSEYNLQNLGVELLGADTGCRTAIIYSPEDLGCYWQYLVRHAPPNRNPNLTANVLRAMKIGTNVIAYATGREILNKLEMPQLTPQDTEQQIERGLLQIAQIRHAGTWNAAPRALRNLLNALNQTAGIAVSQQPRDLLLSDPQVYNFPLIYMHGRQQFQLNKQERERLREYLENGGVLFADACCGAKLFDKSFRELMQQVFPAKKLERIPLEHELFSEVNGQDVRRLKRRVIEGTGNDTAAQIRELEAVVEGIELDGRYAVIYSKYDLSCALERQSTIQCEGYTSEDAVKLATNIVLYAITQNYNLKTASP